jgi:hypothetical protein
VLCNGRIQKYATTMKTLQICGWTVDLEALRELEYRCEPTRCGKETCCGHYEVVISRRERERLTGLLEEVTRVRQASGMEEVDYPFESAGGGKASLETDEDGRCRLLFKEKGAYLCGIHAIALSHGVAPEKWKPRSCMLWPLAVSDGGRRELGVQEGAEAFPCVERVAGKRDIAPEVLEIVEAVFGKRFRRELERQA